MPRSGHVPRNFLLACSPVADLDGVLALPHEPDTLLGGSGNDRGLIGSFEEDETDDVELVFDSLEDLLAAM